MDQGRSYEYASPNLEDQLRNMILHHNGPQQLHAPAQYQPSHPSQSHPLRPPPGFGMPPPMTAQPHYSNVPADRQQDFSQFLQQHHATAPVPLAPHRVPQPPYGNNHRPQGFQGPHRNQNTRPPGPHSYRNPRPMDPNAFDRPRQDPRSYPSHPQQQQRQLYQPQSRPQQSHNPYVERQTSFLERLAEQEIGKTQMMDSEVEMKDAFRVTLQNIFENLKSPDPENPLPLVELASFGSLRSGFATAGSDMDLAIVTSSDNDLSQRFSSHENGLPRVLEKELLDNGIGARLLTRTRVPIIKICERPTPELLNALREDRDKWDNLSDDEKYATSKPSTEDTTPKQDASNREQDTAQPEPQIDVAGSAAQNGSEPQAAKDTDPAVSLVESTQTSQVDGRMSSNAAQATSQSENLQQPNQPVQDKQANRQRNDRSWRREKAAGPLDFPKSGVGIQCDINFFNPLGIHNTQMLRCYAMCDPRVRPMVLFIKSWAKRRKINSSYSGTLSSYGYVLMVLHYLVNVENPPVLPNLQHEAEAYNIPPTMVDNYEVRFFNREDLIQSRASQGAITQNNEPLGKLLVGFFKYYAVNAGGFFWTRDVLSLRTPGGILTKDEKGWTGARTEIGETKEVRHRYLFAIEDPFETTHNVARTVTHNGICAIRDEFRRAWRIISAVGRNREEPEGGLFDELTEAEEQPATNTGPPPTVNKVQAYGQQFPTLGGQQVSSAPQKVSSPVRAPVQPARVGPAPEQAPTQKPAPSQAETVSTAPRGKGRRQKFVPLDL